MKKFALAMLFVIGVPVLLAGRSHVSPRGTVFEQRINLAPEARPGESLGTAFEVEADGVRCAAGYVNSVQTRVYTNQNQLEFWCREDSRALNLEFKSIGKGYEGQFFSSIMNHRGLLFDVVSEFSWTPKGWSFLRNRDHIDGGRVVSLQTRRGKDYWFVVGAGVCEGLSLFSVDGYHGTYSGDGWGAWSAIYTDGDVVIANIGHKMLTGPVLAPDAPKGCREMSLMVFDDRPTWTYVIMPHDGRVIYGAPASKGRCAPLATFDGTSVVSQQPLDCEGEQITEYYSITPFMDKLLIGNYPTGTLWASMSPISMPQKTILAKPRSDDGLRDGIDVYRESQSVVTTYGGVFTGMFPWGELFAYDHHSRMETVTRIFPGPEKDGRDYAPFVRTGLVTV